MRVYTLLVYLAENPPIRRRLKLLANHTLKELHHTIIRSFHMVKVSKSGMYAATEKWRKKDKFVLARMPGQEEATLMENLTVAAYFNTPKKKLVYDCSTHRNWTFNIELVKVQEKKSGKESKYPDWDNPLGHELNDYKRDIAIADDEEDMDDYMDEMDLAEALREYENMDDDDD